MRICLFEDGAAGGLEPLTALRPVFELVCGATSLAAKQCRHFAPCAVGVLVRPHLAELVRLQHPGTPVNDLAWLRAEPTVLVNGRWLPPPSPAVSLNGRCVALSGDAVAYAVVGPDLLTSCQSETLDDCLRHWAETLPQRPAGGALVARPWDLVEHNAAQLCGDFERAAAAAPAATCPPHVAVV